MVKKTSSLRSVPLISGVLHILALLVIDMISHRKLPELPTFPQLKFYTHGPSKDFFNTKSSLQNKTVGFNSHNIPTC